MDKVKRCKVCDDYPDEVISHVNSMMFLSNASIPAIQKYFSEDMELKAPTRDMIRRHRSRNHHVPSGMMSAEESAQLRKINGRKDVEIYNSLATTITIKTLPKLAFLEESIKPLEEKMELFAVMKDALATELESIQSRPIVIENQLTGEQVVINPLTKNAKELMRMMGIQLDSIEKSQESITNVKQDVTEDLIFAFMQLLGKTKLDVEKATTMVYPAEVIKEEDIEEITIEEP